jgi:hypothetical protein
MLLESMVSSALTLKKDYKINAGDKVGQGGFGKVYSGKPLSSPGLVSLLSSRELSG